MLAVQRITQEGGRARALGLLGTRHSEKSPLRASRSTVVCAAATQPEMKLRVGLGRPPAPLIHPGQQQSDIAGAENYTGGRQGPRPRPPWHQKLLKNTLRASRSTMACTAATEAELELRVGLQHARCSGPGAPLGAMPWNECRLVAEMGSCALGTLTTMH